MHEFELKCEPKFVWKMYECRLLDALFASHNLNLIADNEIVSHGKWDIE